MSVVTRRRALAVVVVVLLVLARCGLARRVAGPPALPVPAVPPALCAGSTQSGELFTVVNVAHDAHAAEARELVTGGHESVVGEVRLENIGRHPACELPDAAIVHDRIERALDAFFTRKDARFQPSLRSSVAVRVGCEAADGTLLVALELWFALGESASATYLVDPHAARLAVGGFALAHTDLDVDGIRDVVWEDADGQVNVDLSASHRTRKTSMHVPENEDSDGFFAAAPALEGAFALLLAYHTAANSLSIHTRLLWNGKELAPVERLTDDGFEERFAVAKEREEALLDDSMFGGFGKVHSDLLKCADAHAVTPECTTVLDAAATALTKGGIPDAYARSLVRSYFGWQPCTAGTASGT